MVSKESFCKLINCLKSVDSYMDKIHSLGFTISDDNLLFDVGEAIVDTLEKEMNAEGSISYYCWERNYDGENMDGVPTPFLWDENGKEVWIKSTEDLYDYLVEENKKLWQLKT